MRKLFAISLCVLLIATVAVAQASQPSATPKKTNSAAAAKKSDTAPGMPMPTPPPELKRLAYFNGDWTTIGTMKPGPMGPGGKFSGHDHFDWLGPFFLVSHSTGSMPGMGNMKEIAVFGYDKEKGVYTYSAVSSLGMKEEATGVVNGPDWTWTNDMPMGGKTYKAKFMLHEDSPTQYSMKYDVSEDGGNTWTNIMEAKATKTGGSGAAKK